MRDLMCQAGKFEKCDEPVRTKLQYESYMQRKPGAKLPTPQAIQDLESKKSIIEDPCDDLEQVIDLVDEGTPTTADPDDQEHQTDSDAICIEKSSPNRCQQAENNREENESLLN